MATGKQRVKVFKQAEAAIRFRNDKAASGYATNLVRSFALDRWRVYYAKILKKTKRTRRII